MLLRSVSSAQEGERAERAGRRRPMAAAPSERGEEQQRPDAEKEEGKRTSSAARLRMTSPNSSSSSTTTNSRRTPGRSASRGCGFGLVVCLFGWGSEREGSERWRVLVGGGGGERARARARAAIRWFLIWFAVIALLLAGVCASWAAREERGGARHRSPIGSSGVGRRAAKEMSSFFPPPQKERARGGERERDRQGPPSSLSLTPPKHARRRSKEATGRPRDRAIACYGTVCRARRIGRSHRRDVRAARAIGRERGSGVSSPTERKKK